MSAVATTTLVDEIRSFLAGKPAEAFRSVPIAKAVGEKDIRRVRQALKQLKDAGEVVTCTVYRGEEPPDEEYRIVASGTPMPKTNPMTLSPFATPRRPDSSAIPSHFGKGDPPSAASKPIAHAGAAYREVKPFKVVEMPPPPLRVANACKDCGVTPPKPHLEWCATRRAIKAPGALDSEECRRRAAAQARRARILQYIAAVNRPVTSGELLAHAQVAEPELRPEQLQNTLQEMLLRVTLERCPRVPDPRRRGCSLMTYATPEIAARHVPGAKANEELAAPVAPVEAPQEPEQGTLGRIPQFVTASAPAASKRAARTRLTAFFAEGDGNWYGLPWLVRVAGGHVPATLEAIAELQVDGRLAYSEADRAPIWRRDGSDW